MIRSPDVAYAGGQPDGKGSEGEVVRADRPLRPRCLMDSSREFTVFAITENTRAFMSLQRTPITRS